MNQNDNAVLSLLLKHGIDRENAEFLCRLAGHGNPETLSKTFLKAFVSAVSIVALACVAGYGFTVALAS